MSKKIHQPKKETIDTINLIEATSELVVQQELRMDQLNIFMET